jgi:hypothetical protein
MVIQETGVAPETLPLAPDIKIVKKALKSTGKSFSQLDDLESQRVIEAEYMTSLPEARRETSFRSAPSASPVAKARILVPSSVRPARLQVGAM